MPAWRVSAWTHPQDPNGFGPREHSIPFLRYQGNDPEEPRGRVTITVPETYDWQTLIAVQDPSNPADTSLIRVYPDGTDNTGRPDVEYLLQRFQKVIQEDGTATVELYGVDWRLAALDTTVARWWDWEPGNVVSLLKDWEYGGPNILGDGFENVGTQPDVWDLFVAATGGTFDLGPTGDPQTLDHDATDSEVEAALQAATGITDANVEREANVQWQWILTIDATGGTFTIGDGTDDTSALDHDATTTEIRDAIEADIAAVTSVSVSSSAPGTYTITLQDPSSGVFLTVDGGNLTGGTGATMPFEAFGNAYQITMVIPPFGIALELDDANLTGTDHYALLRRDQTGQLQTGSWTISQQVSQGSPRPYGGYDFFGVTTEQAHTGTQSLKIDPGDIALNGRYAGGQVVVQVTPGAIYQAHIWVYTESSTDRYRFVIRTPWGDTLNRVDGTLATDTGGLDGTSYTAGQWHRVDITDIVIPEGVTEIIYRFSNVDAAGDPGAYYLDDPYLARGLAADTIGKISQDLIADCQVDHPTLVRLPYITEGEYTDLLDEAGDAWVRTESITIRRGKKYGTHLYGQQFRDLGYEYDIDPGTGTGGETGPDEANWYLRLWNPGANGAALEETAFVVGFGVKGGLIAGRLPRATRWLAEGKGGIITEVIDTAQEAATGIVEDYIGDDDITDTISLAARAQQELDIDIANKLALSVELDSTSPTPYADFNRGDSARFLYAGTAVAHTRRISDISLQATTDSGEAVWTASVTASRLFRQGHALKEAVYRLLTEYDRIPEEPEEGPVTVNATGGGVPRITMAAGNASERSKAKADADYVATADRAANLDMFLRALTEMDDTRGGEIRITEGSLDMANPGVDIQIPSRVVITGAGEGVTFVRFEIPEPTIRWAQGSGFRNVTWGTISCGG